MQRSIARISALASKMGQIKKSKGQRYTYRVLQTIQMKPILLWFWAEQAVLGRAKTALKIQV